MSVEVGAVVDGVVTGVAKFGAFVELADKKVGLVHVSEVAHEYVNEVADYVKVGDKVRVKVMSMDDKGKIGLSMKQAQERPDSRPNFRRSEHEQRPSGMSNRPPRRKPMGAMSFEDKLSRFLKDSDERLSDLKRNTESKRGGRGARRSD